MFLVIGGLPETTNAVALAARLVGMAPPDAARLLAGTLPRILLRSVAHADEVVANLQAEGFLAWAADPAKVPGEEARVLVRDLSWEPGGFRAVDGKGGTHACPFSAVRLLQRGARVHASTQVEITKKRQFDAGRAILSGGLLLTKKVEQVREQTTHAKEPFLLVQRGDGAPDLMIYEHRVSYQCLGPEMSQATLINLGRLTKRFQALCPEAPLDDRVGRPGFVPGLPLMSVDPVDLGLYLVSEALRRGC